MIGKVSDDNGLYPMPFLESNQTNSWDSFGTLVSDFWDAYTVVVCALRQICLMHLLRDLVRVEKYEPPGKN